MSSTTISSKQLPRKTRKRARSLRKSLLTFASSSPAISIHGPKNSSTDAADVAGRGITGDGASSSLNNSEDDDHLSPPPLMMRDASVASRSSSTQISRSFRRTASSRHVDPADTVWWGWVLLITTWVVFVMGMGSVLGIWDWAWYGPAGPPVVPEDEDHDPDDDLPIPGYYPALMILTWVVAWVWVVVAWVGMKYFRHARVAPPNESDKG
ncbi:hypothetical protein H072_8938 [Dactylellina haptotyla CBS 200.50]|uniref:Uncharacterized protein n=1 Tax=Dactylellina haptotyla (strain CBS 200.50) TaxID=1284197 RepID=S8BQ84_DACHA|nr:hypothetical protein H072_8938 [Dactylellina haptotyla CBS 200.50]